MTTVSQPSEVRALEVRYHPKGEADYVVAGHLIWHGPVDQGFPILELSDSPPASAPRGHLRSKLAYLIRATRPASFARLQALRSHFWSFVEVASER